MLFFQYQEIAKVCSISECAGWIAFGKLPLADYSLASPEKEPVDHRINIDAIIDLGGSPYVTDLFFDARTLKNLAPVIVYSEYESAIIKTGMNTPNQIRKEIQQHAETYARLAASGGTTDDGTPFSEVFADAPNMGLEGELEAAIWLERAQTPLRFLLERAQSEVFKALADGCLVGNGIKTRLENDEDDSDYWPNALSQIRADEWTHSGIDWAASNLKTIDWNYLGVTVSVNQMLEHFKLPRIEPIDVSGKLYGETVLLNMDQQELSSTNQAKMRRGAPLKIESIAQKAILRHVQAALTSGTIAAQAEALTQEACVWAEKVFGEPLKRSTAQRYIAPLLDALPRKSARN